MSNFDIANVITKLILCITLLIINIFLILDIYDKIHIELKNNRLTKAQLADFIGISREHFTRIFGKKDLSNLQLMKASDFIDVLKNAYQNAYQLGQANNPLNHSIHNTSDNAESHNPQ